MTTNDELVERCANRARQIVSTQLGKSWNSTSTIDEMWRDVVEAVLAEAASETEPRPPVPDQDGEATAEQIMANADYPLHGTLAVHLWQTYGEVRTVKQALTAADAVGDALDAVNAVTAYRTDLACNQRPAGPRVAPDPAAHTLSDAMTAFDRDDTGRLKLRRRSFGESVRWLLDLPPDTDDGDVLAELAVRKHETAGPRVAPEPRSAVRWAHREWAADIAGRMDWNPTCEAGHERETIVWQVLNCALNETPRLAGRPEQEADRG